MADFLVSLIKNILKNSPINQGKNFNLGDFSSGSGNTSSGSLTTELGNELNNITGVTGQQNFQIKYLQDYYTNLVNSMSRAGLNAAAMLSGAGASPNSPGPISSASSYGQVLSLIPGLLNSAANMRRANADYIAKDRYNRHLDWQEKEDVETVDRKISNNINDLVSKVVTTTRRGKR